MPIEWRDAMALGVPDLDADHKRFVTLVNACEKACIEQNVEMSQRVFELAAEYAQNHFKREEVFMLSNGFPEYEAHKRAHSAMSLDLRGLWRGFLAEPDVKAKIRLTHKLHESLTKWLVEHILRDDMKLRQGRKPGMPAAKGTVVAASEVKSRTQDVVRRADVEYELPPHLSHLLIRSEYLLAEMPPIEEDFTSFEALCESAILRRIDKILVFFQRSNPAVKRKLPPIFLASPVFAEKFHQAVKQFIMPVILSSRQIKMMAAAFDCTGVNNEDFWDQVKPILKENILSSWSLAWDDLRLLPNRKPDGSVIMQVKEETKALRGVLAPAPEDNYDLPRVGNREIGVFISLLDTVHDWWKELNRAWEIVQDIYEQEKDPRVFQDRARTGALRDNLLQAFQRFPDQWGDFLVLACHRMFPRVNTIFLDRFTTNLGRNEAEREVYLPYTIHYLRLVKADPSIHAHEMEEEEAWEAEMEELRKYLKGLPDDKRG